MFTNAISFVPQEPDQVSLAHHGLLRSYRVWTPEPTRGSPPVLLLFHGWSSSAEKIAAASSLPDAAAALGWLVIAPQGSGQPARWAIPDRVDGPDDLAFVERVLADAARRWNADRSRVAVAGFSNGAAFASLLSCRMPVIGLTLVGGAGFGDPCDRAAALPVVLAHGAADSVVRLAGGPVLGGRLHAAPFADAVRQWTAAGATVDAVAIEGWGHTWPDEATTKTLEMLAGLATTFAM